MEGSSDLSPPRTCTKHTCIKNTINTYWVEDVRYGSLQSPPKAYATYMRWFSSIGRVLVSKTRGCGFDSCLTCLRIDDAVHSGGVFIRKTRSSLWQKKLAKKRNARTYVRWWRETVGGVAKVTWPTPEAWHLTRIVIVVMMIMSAFCVYPGFFILQTNHSTSGIILLG